jgi:pimeloyl-ACP methyl ester carboxylesterase
VTTPPSVNGHRVVSSRRLVVGGLGLHTWVSGAGKSVMLVHGFGVSGRYMLPLAGSLAECFSVFVPDLPGYGRRERPQMPLGIGGLAAALAGLTTHLRDG